MNLCMSSTEGSQEKPVENKLVGFPMRCKNKQISLIKVKNSSSEKKKPQSTKPHKLLNHLHFYFLNTGKITISAEL